MNDKQKHNVFDITYLLVTILSFIIFLILFLLTEVKVKPIPYFIFVIVIVFLEGELINYLLKKDMLFFRINAEYSQNNISIKHERFLYFVMDIAIIILLILFIYFNDHFYRIISLVNKDKVRGGILITLIIGLFGSTIFWAHYFIMKWVRGKQVNKKHH